MMRYIVQCLATKKYLSTLEKDLIDYAPHATQFATKQRAIDHAFANGIVLFTIVEAYS